MTVGSQDGGGCLLVSIGTASLVGLVTLFFYLLLFF